MKFSTLLILLLSILVCTSVASCTSINANPAENTEKKSTDSKENEQALIVYLALSDGKFGSKKERAALFQLEGKLEQIVRDGKLGVFDGNEFGGGQCTFYMYGPDTDALSKAVIPAIKEFGPRMGSYYTKRYGTVEDTNAKEETIKFTTE